MSSNKEGDLSKKSIIEMEDMLVREKSLLKNKLFLQKLPDKGAKLELKVEKIAVELEARKALEKEKARLNFQRSQVEHLEWTLRTGMESLEIGDNLKKSSDLTTEESTAGCPRNADLNRLTSSNSTELERTLEMIATSQISQKESKKEYVISSKGKITRSKDCDSSSSRKNVSVDAANKDAQVDTAPIECPLHSERLAYLINQRDGKCKFVPNKVKSKGCSGNSSRDSVELNGEERLKSVVICSEELIRNEVYETCSSASNSSSSNYMDADCGGRKMDKKPSNWDEALLPPQNFFGKVKPLSMEESFCLGREQSHKLNCNNYAEENLVRANNDLEDSLIHANDDFEESLVHANDDLE